VVEVRVEGDDFVFEVQGWDRLWGLRSRLQIPRAHVRGVEVRPQLRRGVFDLIKLAGTDVPGLFQAGSFIQDGQLVFWDVRHPDHTIAVELDHERYKRLVIDVPDPEVTARLIVNSLTSPPAKPT
jgi:hypothetical protein